MQIQKLSPKANLLGHLAMLPASHTSSESSRVADEMELGAASLLEQSPSARHLTGSALGICSFP